jgi:hypothetical protein
MPKPAIFIPGFPASELHDRKTGEKLYPPALSVLLNHQKLQALIDKLIREQPDEAKAGPPILDTIEHFAPAASTLYAILRGAPYLYDTSPQSASFIPIGWDWRKSIGSPETLARVKAALDKLSPDRRKSVVAIVHSTGGLVLRAFLNAHPDYAGRIEQVLAFGVPWRGALEALHAVDRGAELKVGPLKLLSAEQSKELLTHAQAAYDLFPNVEATRLFFAGDAPSTPLADRTWLDPLRPYMDALCDRAVPPFGDFDDMPVTNVCAWGGPTWPVCRNVDGQLDFAPPENEAGDGTVPFVSASALRGNMVRSMFLPIGAFGDGGLIPQLHAQIWEPKAVRQLFDEVLVDAPRRPLVAAAADKDQYIDARAPKVRVRVAATAAGGAPLPNARVSYRVGPRIETHSFEGEKRLDVDLARGAFEQQVSGNIRRTELTVSWDGGPPVKIPILVMA